MARCCVDWLLCCVCVAIARITMAIKTLKNQGSVLEYILSVGDTARVAEGKALLKIFTDVLKEKPVMWGNSLVGFGEYHYKSERSTQEGDWPLTAFSIRKAALTVYIMPGFDTYETLMKKLGKFKTGKSCLYIKRLADVDVKILQMLIVKSVAEMKKKHH